ncbi:type II secretion system protein N [Zoogloea sp.]|uniref:type II secretion system protein N n=1 Tax=Zoogloea sp. TaxID=49181 RepID=UPI00261BE603|nr:type II secretion system protein N [Zoogloea sp.]MDD3354605.1 type II secretion system protein N [Zoogloea sp.]
MKLLIFGLLSLVLVILKAPASLIDGLLAHATQGGLRLQQAEGSLWQGRGILASREAEGRSLLPWMPLAWDFDTATLTRGALGWRFSSSGTSIGQIEGGFGGLRIADLRLHAPAGAVLSPIPHPAARAGWMGDLSITAPRWECGRDGHCQGSAQLLWRGARSALFPGRSFGDYQLQMDARGQTLHYTLQTLTGDIRLEGSGEAPFRGSPRFSGRIQGDPAFLARLPAIAGGAARPAGAPGQFELHWPPR